jgi:hypothetical protein
VLLDVVEVLVDDRDVDLVVAEDLGLDEQALAEIARGDADGIEPLDHREDLRASSGSSPASGRDLDREVRASVPSGRSTPLRSR